MSDATHTDNFILLTILTYLVQPGVDPTTFEYRCNLPSTFADTDFVRIASLFHN